MVGSVVLLLLFLHDDTAKQIATNNKPEKIFLCIIYRRIFHVNINKESKLAKNTWEKGNKLIRICG